jgi:hypothetical protein
VLEVGGIVARLGASFDGHGFDKFDRAMGTARREAARPVEGKLTASLHAAGFQEFDRALGKARGEKPVTTTLRGEFDGRGFTKYDEAAKRTQETNKRVETSFASMAKRIVSGAVAFGAAYAGIEGAKNAIETTETLGKSVIQLTRNFGLSTEAATAWATQAKARGIETNRLTMSFKTLSAQVEAGAAGTKKQAQAFDRLGISQQDLRKHGNDLQWVLGQVSDGLAKMPSGTARAATASQLFGRSWATLMPLLTGGKKAMDDQLALAKKYGVDFGSGTDGIKKMAAAQREVQIATLGMQVQFTKKLEPVLLKLMGWFADGVRAVSQFVRQVVDGGKHIGGFASAVRTAIGVITNVVHWLTQTRAGFAVLGGVIGGIVSRLAVLAVAWGVSKIQAFVGAIGGAIKAIQSLGKAEAATPWGAIATVIGVVVGAIFGLSQGTKRATVSADDLTDALKAQRDALRAVKDLDIQAAQAKLNLAQANQRVREDEQRLIDLRKNGQKGTNDYKDAELELRQARIDQTQAQRDESRQEQNAKDTRTAFTRSTRDATTAARGRIKSIQDEIRDTKTIIQWQGTNARSTKLLHDLEGQLHSAQDQLNQAMRNSKEAGATGRKGFQTMGRSAGAFGSIVQGVTNYLKDAVNKELGTFGAKGLSFSLGSLVMAPIRGVENLLGFAGGGMIGHPGERGADTELALLGRGEAVLNYDHQGVVNYAMQVAHSVGALPYGDLYEMFDRRHALHFAGGGFVPKRYAGGGVSFSGPVSTFGPPGEAAGSTALSGHSSAEPGLSLRIPGTTWSDGRNRALMGHVFRLVVGGHSANLRDIDLGPADWTGKNIDVTGAGVAALGIPYGSFPTGAIGSVTELDAGAVTSVGGGGSAFKALTAPKVGGSPGPLRDAAQGIAAKLTAAGNKFLASKAPTVGIGGAGAPALTGMPGVDKMIREANAIASHNYAYQWGGGHGSLGSPTGGPGPGYDCSGAVSAVLGADGLIGSPEVASQFMGYGAPGPGKWVSIYASPGHVFMSLMGRYFGTSGQNPGGGANWIPRFPENMPAVRHPPGFAAGGMVTPRDAGSLPERLLRQLPPAFRDREARRHRLNPLAILPGFTRGRLPSYKRGKTPTRRVAGGKKVKGLGKGSATLVGESNGPSVSLNSLKRSVARGESGLAGYERKIQDLERHYGQVDRQFSQSDEVFLIEHDDGSTTVDRAAVKARLGELNQLIRLRNQIIRTIQEYRRKVQKLMAAYEKAMQELRTLLSFTKGKKNRQGYQDALSAYQQRVGELKGTADDLGFDIADSQLDLGDLAKEKWTVAGTRGSAAAGSGDVGGGGDVGSGDAGGGDTSGGDTGSGGDTSGGDTGSGGDTSGGGSSAGDIAAAAAALFQQFTAERQQLFATFGSNYVPAGAGLPNDASTAAAGVRYYGAVPAAGGPAAGSAGSPASGAAATAPQIKIEQNFAAPPPDPHTWSQGIGFEIKAAL